MTSDPTGHCESYISTCPLALTAVFKYTIVNTATLYRLIAVEPSPVICT